MQRVRRLIKKRGANLSVPETVEPENLASNDKVNAVNDNRPIAVIDAETDPFKHGRFPKPFLWGFYDGTTYLQFEKTADLVAHIREFDGIVYAHNGGKFDFHFMLSEFTRGIPVMLINGRIVKANIGACEVRDSYALLPAPLSAYQKDEIDYKIFEKRLRNKPENMRKIREYLKTDCCYLYDLVVNFITEHGMALTQAGAAMAKWEEIQGEKAPQSSADFFSHFSQFYYGGRVECFKAGRIPGPHKLYDIKSAYPRAMLEPHPYKLNYTICNNPAPEKIKETSFIEVDCISDGALPFRDGRKILFPKDGIKRRYYCVGHEYIAGLALGLIRDCTVIRCYNFLLEKDFRAYIEPLYEIKNNADRHIAAIKAGLAPVERLDHWLRIRLFAKLLMNSLYGKFGANPDNYGHYLLAHDGYELADYPGYEKYAELEDIDALSMPLKDHEKRFYNVATAASITSWVRAFLLRAICASDDVLYCDTDSILCARFGGELGDELGQWAFEGDVIESRIAGKKMYALKMTNGKWKVASKGVKLTHKEISEMCEGKTVLFKPESPTYSVSGKPRFTNRSVKMLDEVRVKIALAG